MTRIIDSPFFVFFVALVCQWGAAYAGDLCRRTLRPDWKDAMADFDIVLTATLTLLALIIGFSFSMAVSRYDQRKNYEEAEANAIGTEYARADLLPADARLNVRELLTGYLRQRIQFYQGAISEVDSDTAKLQAKLWASVVNASTAQPTLIVALAVSGMNDVLNSQGYTQAAWWNRIPGAAWFLMGLIAIFSNLLLGYRERNRGFLLILPVIVSIAFFLIADIDSPNGGVIHVAPQNLIAVLQSVEAQ